jgi:hypothetical protein
VYDVFWWCSAMARMDTRDTRSDLGDRYPSGGATFIRSMLPPEEATTFAFVRRLATQYRKRGGAGVVSLHSRALEGGRAGKWPPSGADIEMAVEVAPGTWIDLLLQAKRIFEPRTGQDSVYADWTVTQIRNLCHWAKHNGDRTPGMLLYNAEFSPFVPPSYDVTLDGCGRSPVRCHGWRWPTWEPPDRRSPTAITLIALPSDPSEWPAPLSVEPMPAYLANQYASPLECIFCPGRLANASQTCGGRTGPPVSMIKPKNQIPGWAATLLAAVDQRAAAGADAAVLSSSDQRFSDDDWDARYSIVLPHIESEG